MNIRIPTPSSLCLKIQDDDLVIHSDTDELTSSQGMRPILTKHSLIKEKFDSSSKNSTSKLEKSETLGTKLRRHVFKQIKIITPKLEVENNQNKGKLRTRKIIVHKPTQIKKVLQK